MNYYNENDRKAAAWLRELIRCGHIAPGDVDERSILDVRATDLDGYVQCHFFAGVGGWSYALRLAGWPDDKPVYTGSCPCQPFSQAGKGLAEKDERHLWPVFRELISQRNPATVFGEQVASKAGRLWLAGVRADLEALGYAVGAADLCAAGIGAPHIRQRLFWVANANKRGRTAGNSEAGPREAALLAGQPVQGLGGLADANMPVGNGRPRIGEQSVHSQDKESCGLAEPESNGLARGQTARNGRTGVAYDCGVVQPHRTGRNEGQSATETARHGGSIESTSGSGGVGHADNQGSQGHGQSGRNSETGGANEARHDTDSGPWSNFDLTPCADRKTRRVESGTFPLAHGVSNRVGLLRGYGNAIVPQVAAEFIQAFGQTLNQIESLNHDTTQSNHD